MNRTFARAAVVVALALGGGAHVFAQTEGVSRREAQAEAFIAARVDAARERAAPNAPRLVSDPDLVRIARARSRAMAHGAPFSHQDEQGRYPAIDLVKARFGPYGSIGENLGLETGLMSGFDPDAFAKRMVEGWMTSEEHRENILSPDYTMSGVGVAIMGDRVYATQVFRGAAR